MWKILADDDDSSDGMPGALADGKMEQGTEDEMDVDDDDDTSADKGGTNEEYAQPRDKTSSDRRSLVRSEPKDTKAKDSKAKDSKEATLLYYSDVELEREIARFAKWLVDQVNTKTMEGRLQQDDFVFGV